MSRSRSSRGAAPAGLVLAVAAVLVAIGLFTGAGRLGSLGGASSGEGSSGDAATPVPSITGTAGSAIALLATLPIKGKSPLTGYDRVGDFGPAWDDVDKNHCDTRDDVLHRDLTGIRSSGCKVESGTLHDPYTGHIIHFVRGDTTSAAVQIDHIVPLAEAWRTGAQKLSASQRLHLANDLTNLFAVDGPTNQAKGDGDAATWLPPQKSFRCTYVAHQISVKAAYHLWVTQAEHDAIVRVLSTCPDERAPVDTFAPAS